MKVCILAWAFYLHDARIKRYAEALADRGDSVDVICLASNNDLNKKCKRTINKVNIHEVQKRNRQERSKIKYIINLSKFFFISACYITKLYLRKKYDVIHVHNIPDFEVFATILPKLLGAKIILDIHDPLPDFFADKFNVKGKSIVLKFLQLIELASTKFADHVITVTDYWKDRIATRSSIPEEKISVFVNYPDLRIFDYSKFRNAPKEDDGFTLIYTGSLQKHYANDNVIRSIELLRRKIPSIKFLIYGFGAEVDKLKLIVDSCALKNQVYFNKPVAIEEIPRIIRQADVGMVLLKETSKYAQHALSLKLFEYMAMGIPVVATRTEAIECYLNESIIMFSNSSNPEDIAMCIEELFSNKLKREELIKNGLGYIGNNNWEANKERYFGVIDGLLKRN